MSILNRVMMKHYPNFNLMGEKEKVDFLSNTSSVYKKAIVLELYRQISGNTDTLYSYEDITSNVLKEMSNENRHMFNKLRCYVEGVGMNRFTMNDPSYEPDSYVTHETLYQMDREKFLDNEKLLREYRKGFREEVPTYISTLYGAWCRFYIKDVFYYGFLYTKGHYVYQQIEEKAEEYLDTLIPSEVIIVESKNPFDVKNWQVVANGQEDILEEVRQRLIQDYLIPLAKDLPVRLENSGRSVAILDSVDDWGCKTKTFVYSNTKCLEKIRMSHFYDDTESLGIVEVESLTDLVEEEFNKVKKFIDKVYSEYAQN